MLIYQKLEGELYWVPKTYFKVFQFGDKPRIAVSKVWSHISKQPRRIIHFFFPGSRCEPVVSAFFFTFEFPNSHNDAENFKFSDDGGKKIRIFFASIQQILISVLREIKRSQKKFTKRQKTRLIFSFPENISLFQAIQAISSLLSHHCSVFKLDICDRWWWELVLVHIIHHERKPTNICIHTTSVYKWKIHGGSKFFITLISTYVQKTQHLPCGFILLNI